MDTTTNGETRTAAAGLGAAAAAVAVPAMLFLGAGTAQANTIRIDTWPGYAGVTVHFTNTSQEEFRNCTYRAKGNKGGSYGPVLIGWYGYVEAGNTVDLPIPGIATNQNWQINVTCQDAKGIQGSNYYSYNF